MITVLHILNSDEYSGAEKVTISIIKKYPSQIQGIYMSRMGSIKDAVEKEKIEYIGVTKLGVHEVKRAIRMVHPDVIHAHDYMASVVTAIAAGTIPVISHLHNNVPWMRSRTIRSLIYRCVIPRVDKILAVSDPVIEECWYRDLLKQKAVCIGNPIDVLELRLHKKSQIESQLLFVGRFSEQKDPLEFLNIVHELHADGVPVTATMLGRGKMEPLCRSWIREHGLSAYVNMTGFVENPYDYMNEGAVLVMPSKWEGYGLAAVEALTFGVPVVGNPVGGLQKIVTEECGYLSSERSGKIKELKRLIGDKEYYRKKSVAAKKRAAELNNIQEYMQILERIYREVVGMYTCT